jgi:DNA polymerase III epsilon subunit-like protein
MLPRREVSVLRGRQHSEESRSIFSYPVAVKPGHDLSAAPIVAIDFETTGLNANFDRVVEVGRSGDGNGTLIWPRF